jgi:hypothetical protein
MAVIRAAGWLSQPAGVARLGMSPALVYRLVGGE